MQIEFKVDEKNLENNAPAIVVTKCKTCSTQSKMSFVGKQNGYGFSPETCLYNCSNCMSTLCFCEREQLETFFDSLDYAIFEKGYVKVNGHDLYFLPLSD